MQYRIELSPGRSGQARVTVAGRAFALEANHHMGSLWVVGIIDVGGDPEQHMLTVRADNPGNAVWRIAQATVRAVAELTQSPLDGEITPSEPEYLSNLR